MTEVDGDLDYDEIPDYDEVPDGVSHVQSSSDSMGSSNFKSSTQIYPISPGYRGTDSGKVDSAKSSASSLSYHQGNFFNIMFP